MLSVVGNFRSMILSNLRCTSGRIAGAYDIDVAGKEMFVGNVGGELTGVGEGFVTVVIGIIYAGADDVAIAGVIGWGLDGVTDDPGAGTFRVEGAGVNPPLFDGVPDEIYTGVIVGLNGGVFVKKPDD